MVSVSNETCMEYGLVVGLCMSLYGEHGSRRWVSVCLFYAWSCLWLVTLSLHDILIMCRELCLNLEACMKGLCIDV